MARVVRFPTDEVEKLDEEFLYHLNRGAEHLGKGEPEQACVMLARAAELRPRDAKALGLLGQAYYRLGRYGEAAEAYGRLLQEHPQEPGSQVNLGLALLKTGRPSEAVVHLERALDLNPEHKRAMGYLGLAWLEQGSVARAREWFERAGRTQMVERCDAILRGDQRQDAKKAEEWRVAAQGAIDARADAEVEQELQDALRILEQGTRAAAPVAANTAPPAPTSPSSWTAVPAGEVRRDPPAAAATTAAAPGAAAPPAPAVPHRTVGFTAPSPVAHARPASPPSAPAVAPVIATPAVPSPPAAPAADGPRAEPAPAQPATFALGAVVRVAVAGEVLVRQAGLLAVEGQVELAPETRRLRGRAVSESFGTGREAMQRAKGRGALVFAPAARHFQVLRVDGAAGHFREDAVFAFEAGLAFENGRLAAPGAPEIELVRLSGDGDVLVTTRAELVTLEVVPDRPVRVAGAALVGWTGALTPRLLPLARPHADPDAVELSGEGRVLLDPGAPLA